MERISKIPFTLFFITGNLASILSHGQRTNTISTFMCDPLAPTSITMSTNAPSNLTVCGSSQWNFDIDYTGGDLYQWKILDPAMGSIVAGNNSPHVEVLFNNPLGSFEDVDVIVAVTKCNQTFRDTLTMTVINPPEYTVTPSSTTVCAEEEVSFSISPTPTGYSDLTWNFGDGSPASQTPTYAYPNNNNTAHYNPVATIVGPEGCETTVTVPAGTVEVLPAPVALLSPAGTLLDCGPFSATLSATVTTGFGSTTNYTWTGPNLSPPPPNCPGCNTWDINTYGGPYQVLVENSNGCVGESNEVYVMETCDPGCAGPTLISSSSSFEACATVQANIEYDPSIFDILSETWVFPSQAIYTNFSLGTNAWAQASFEEAGVYPFNYIVETASCIKIFKQSVYVPFVGDMYYSVTCGSGSLYDVTLYDHSNIFPLEVGSMINSYAYSNDGGSNWTPISGGNNVLTVNVQLPAGDYQFREIIYSTNSSAPPCTTVVNVILPDKPNADFEIVSPFEPACINDVVVHLNNLSTPSTGLNFVWNFGEEYTNYQTNPDKVYSELGIKTITLTATSSIGCTDIAQSTIEIQDNNLWDGNKPSLVMSPSPPVCIGTPINLTYFNLGSPTPPTFTWYQGSIPLTPAVSSSSFNVTQAGSYWVMGSDEYGCLVPSNAASVYFTPLPTPTIIGNPAQCDNVPFTLTSSINTPGISLEWERSPGGVIGTGSSVSETLSVGVYTYTLTATQNGCEGISVPYTVTVSSPVDPPSVSFDIVSCEPYVVELTATNSQSGTYHWSNGSTGSIVNGHFGGLYEVYFTSNSGCISSNELSVPHSPQEYMWNFPTGCFCLDDLLEENTLSTCAGPPVIPGPYNPFAYWSYMVNGVEVFSGTGTPLNFSDFQPDSINLILDNGYCHIVSDAMYISEECGGPGQQGLMAAGGDPGSGFDTMTDVADSHSAILTPEINLIPNPATHQTRIQYRFDGSESQKTIEVFDIAGRKLKTITPHNNAGSISLQLGDFKSGIYQICLKQDGRIIAQSKLSVTP